MAAGKARGRASGNVGGGREIVAWKVYKGATGQVSVEGIGYIAIDNVAIIRDRNGRFLAEGDFRQFQPHPSFGRRNPQRSRGKAAGSKEAQDAPRKNKVATGRGMAKTVRLPSGRKPASRPGRKVRHRNRAS